MSASRPIFLALLLVLSSVAGCLSNDDSSEKESEDNDKTITEPDSEPVDDLFVACFGESSNSSACNVESVYGANGEPLAPVEFSSHDHSVDEGHNPSGLEHKHEHFLEPPNFPDRLESMATSTSGRSCSSADLIGLSSQDLVSYLISSTDLCIYYLWSFNSDIGATITDSNLQYVANEITSLSSSYQGDNSQGMYQLLFFMRVSWYHESAQSSVTYTQQTFDSTQLAAMSMEGSQHILDGSDDARKILRQLVI